MFPALQSLHIQDVNFTGSIVVGEDFHGIHDINILKNSVMVWKHLYKVIGNIYHLYSLGLTTPVFYMHIHGIHRSRFPFLPRLLRSTTPKILSVSIFSPSIEDPTPIQSLIPDEAILTLTHLSLKIHLVSYTSTMIFKQYLGPILENVYSLMKKLTSLIFIKLDVAFINFDADFSEELLNTNRKAVALELVKCLSKSGTSFICVSMQERTCFWRILAKAADNSESRIIMEELDEDLAVKMMNPDTSLQVTQTLLQPMTM
ncbi:hypothetical protein C8Q75DRAFT_405896 [Abortiporus biennis]|nr:hypothetical protein C8Q75DRAFT_405896 [Abortiporus biennis]